MAAFPHTSLIRFIGISLPPPTPPKENKKIVRVWRNGCLEGSLISQPSPLLTRQAGAEEVRSSLCLIGATRASTRHEVDEKHRELVCMHVWTISLSLSISQSITMFVWVTQLRPTIILNEMSPLLTTAKLLAVSSKTSWHNSLFFF